MKKKKENIFLSLMSASPTLPPINKVPYPGSVANLPTRYSDLSENDAK